MKKLLVSVCGFALLFTVGCGKSLDDKAFSFHAVEPTKEAVGTYRAKSVRSYTVDKETGSRSYFEHTFATTGAPKEGDDVDRKSEWKNIPEGKKLTMRLRVNLPLTIKVEEEGKPVFEETRLYTQSQGSDDSWSWRLPGRESAEGALWHILMQLEDNRNAEKKYFEKELNHGSYRISSYINEDRLLVYSFEITNTEDGEDKAMTTVIEMAYEKQ